MKSEIQMRKKYAMESILTIMITENLEFFILQALPIVNNFYT